MKYLCNAVSLEMITDQLSKDFEAIFIECSEIHSVAEVLDTLDQWWVSGGWESVVGHADTANLLTSLLGCDVEMRRVSLSLRPGDEMVVAQFDGPRLPEGATSLPEGASIRWIHCCIH